MDKAHRDPEFRDELIEVWDKLKSIPGGRSKFFAAFTKRPYMIRHWRNGTVVAKPEDKALFLETAAKVLADHEEEMKNNGVRERISEAREKLNNLI